MEKNVMLYLNKKARVNHKQTHGPSFSREFLEKPGIQQETVTTPSGYKDALQLLLVSVFLF